MILRSRRHLTARVLAVTMSLLGVPHGAGAAPADEAVSAAASVPDVSRQQGGQITEVAGGEIRNLLAYDVRSPAIPNVERGTVVAAGQATAHGHRHRGVLFWTAVGAGAGGAVGLIS